MKEILKEVKLNESLISMILGALVVLITGALLISNFRNQTQSLTPSNITTNDNQSDEISTTENDLPISEIQAESGSSELYTVVEGDSLWRIAEREYGTGYEWKEIAKANPALADGDLEIGQEIVIPDTNKILDEAASTTAEGVIETTQPVAQAQPDQTQAEPTIKPEDGNNTYTVQRGDNLWNIAVEVYGDGFRWTDIAEANNLANPHIIHAGNVFNLPR